MAAAWRMLLVWVMGGTLCAGGPGVTASSAAEKSIWGPAELPAGRGSAFPLYRDLGVDTWQTAISFADVAPSRPSRPHDPDDAAYRWPSDLDTALTSASQNGVNVTLMVTQSPSWANGGGSPLSVPSPRAYSDFLVAAKRRYPSIRRWMIWGEPNLSSRFLPNRKGSRRGPRAYARLLDAAYVALKRESRRNVVIGGMTTTAADVQPAHFLHWLRLPNGRRPRMDLYGHNPFPYRFPRIRGRTTGSGLRDMSDMDVFTEEIRRAYTRRCGRRRCGRAPRLWISEFTVQSDKPSYLFRLAVGRVSQARWLTAAFRVADRLPRVASMGWHMLLDHPVAPRSPTMGLMTADGQAKPSLAAFRAAPSRRLRPRVSSPRRISRRRLRSRGVVVVVRPKARGRVVARLLSGSGRVLARVSRRAGPGAAYRLRLRSNGSPGARRIEVAAARGETVRRSIRLTGR